MIPQIGYIALILACSASCMQVFPSFRYIRENAIFIMALTTLSFGCLIYSYATSDFSVLNVYNNSNTLKPLLYKITATWGNHEGSMLLLTIILAAYNCVFTLLPTPDEQTKSIVIRVQNFIAVGFYAFIIFTSNPFKRIFPAPENGLGLNPLLQDVGLAIHPPVLYIGYIGFSLGLSFAIAALIKGDADKIWAAYLNKWVLFSWSFLTLGAGLGSWWAYRELGWGGFWFWDPVENVSLMPWLAATALLHSILVMKKRGSLKIWTILLGIFTFSLSLIGIFLVRSGILTSVHSFASDPTRGVFILAFLGIIINLSFILFAVRAHKIKPTSEFGPLSREGLFLLGNLLLSVACATILLGTLYPIFLEIFSDHSVSVGAPYFNSIFPYFALPALIIAAIAPVLKWQEDFFKTIYTRMWIPFLAAILAAAATLYFPAEKSPLATIAIASSIWLIATMLMLIRDKLKKSGKVSLSFIAMITAHIGAAVLAIGITSSTIWGIESEKIVKMEEAIPMGSYNITLKKMYITGTDNYMTRMGEFLITNQSGDELATLRPEVRYYPVEQSNTTEADIYYTILSNLYIAMGDSDGKGGFVVRTYLKPMINLVWLGCFIMFCSGIIAIFKREKQ